MTYTLQRVSETEYELTNDNGTVIETYNPPINVPDDIRSAMIADDGLESLAAGDYEIIDNTTDEDVEK